MDYGELRRLYPMLSNKEIAARLGMSAGWVATAANRMGWKKDSSYLSGVNRENGRKGIETIKARNESNSDNNGREQGPEELL